MLHHYLYKSSTDNRNHSLTPQYNILSSEQIAAAENRQVALLAKIRDRAVPLVDAFDFTDYDLCSVLGRYDGNVYDNMYKWAQNDPLNKTQVSPAI